MLKTALLTKVACVALVVTIVLPVGKMLFPYVSSEIGAISFSAIEAVVSTTLGFGIYTALFG
jgi:hypothetical protein